jgi:Fe-Mn family superoxide dismutase
MSSPLTRRDAIASLAALGLAPIALPGLRPSRSVLTSTDRFTGELTLPPLPYPFDALEPVIDAETMEIHHDRHHKAYVDNANKALADTDWAARSPEETLAHLADIPADKRTAIRNNIGGHVNHSLFWQLMAPPSAGGGGVPSGPLGDAIGAAFGSFDGSRGFKEKFAGAAAGRFGSGWAWLVVKDKKLEICSTANQDTPLMGEGVAGCSGTPILGLDVWEHAYYLKYRNKRADYIGAWWNVVNWPKVAALFAAATGP